MRAARDRRTHSPSTAPIRTSEFVIADGRAFSRIDSDEDDDATAVARPPIPLWSLQRNEPGWVVGEHMHILLWPPPSLEPTTGRFAGFC